VGDDCEVDITFAGTDGAGPLDRHLGYKIRLDGRAFRPRMHAAPPLIRHSRESGNLQVAQDVGQCAAGCFSSGPGTRWGFGVSVTAPRGLVLWLRWPVSGNTRENLVDGGE